MNITTETSVKGTDKPNARTEAALQRLTQAHQTALLQLAQANERIRQLQAELTLMRAGTQA